MIGLFFIGVYVLFILVAVFLPFLIFRKRVKNYKKKRTILSLIIISIPFFVYAFERTLYEWECSKNVYFYPDEKPDKPEAIAYSGNFFSGDGAYKERDGENRLNLFYDYSFEFIVKIDDIDDFVGIDEKKFYDLLRSGDVVPYQKKIIPDEKKRLIIDGVRYVIYDKARYKFNMISITTYIYDQKEEKILSSVSSVNHSKGQSLVNVLYPYEFDRCSKSKAGYFSVSDLLKKTFK
ncbi:hypothetical protein [Pleionea mediterranea]|uniref:Uncharacterized protein n=1 Tax=Pleionea mediterranea TaxID=523701 RepID=A0A316FAE7_9GAMM|nr:hypothetical protein [Pleionea mediterranea]PWK42802.1 hypothetical protein C8D97_1174 [Pleionea mediterranea]